MVFVSGDRVRLKTGSPVMVVENVVEDRISVTWTDERGERQEEEYRSEMLRPAED